MTKRGWITATALVTVAVVTAVAFVLVDGRVRSSGPLGADGADQSSLKLRPGQSATWGQPIYFNSSKDEVKLLSVKPTQVSEGLEVLGITAGGQEREEGIGVDFGWPARGAGTRRVEGFRLPPETTSGGRDGVELYTGVRADRPGVYTVRGLTITYEVDGQRYRERMQDAVSFCVRKEGNAGKAKCPFPGLGEE